MANRKRLVETLAFICTHPKHWDQSAWRCQTGMCFAGHGVLSIEGATPVVPHKLMSDDYVQNYDINKFVLSPRGSVARKLADVINDRASDDDDQYTVPSAIKASFNRNVQTIGAEATDFFQVTAMQANRLFGANNDIDDLVDLIAEFTGSTNDEIIAMTKATAKANGWRWPRKELAEKFAINW